MKTVTGYLIDPVACTVTQVPVSVEDGSGLADIYKHTQCDCIDLARIGPAGDAVFVDDEGLLKEPECFFGVADYPNPLAGRGLVLGCDAEGETISPAASFDDIKRSVVFFRRFGNNIVRVQP